MANYYSRSPPPLQHPVPTHPAFIPEPPSTPSSPQGYQRYTSSPPGPHQQQQFTQSAYAQFQQPPAYLGQPHPQQPPLAPHEQQYGVPDFSAWGLDGATAQIGMQIGQNAVHAGQEYVQKNLGGLASVSALKHHFNVSNSYVIRKLQLLLFPWRHRPWTRKMRRSEQGQGEFQPPREDINAPDLYIPTMAFVTYILTATLQSGLQARFNPDIFGLSATKALVVVLFDFLFLKGGCYVLGIQTASSVFDLVAYGGYKFVGYVYSLTSYMRAAALGCPDDRD
ncbi:hypothetical protein EWM64_g10233 [Hericium alpestre]|uniref:Protein YIF1 n=1 Tax=Hericium alpestre TaxID=135208 RepID=A0A4Y9ZK17_9AGAM|nr:hypothetical protein EWM64_g10233 [Hericium alpestre]